MRGLEIWVQKVLAVFASSGFFTPLIFQLDYIYIYIYFFFFLKDFYFLRKVSVLAEEEEWERCQVVKC